MVATRSNADDAMPRFYRIGVRLRPAAHARRDRCDGCSRARPPHDEDGAPCRAGRARRSSTLADTVRPTASRKSWRGSPAIARVAVAVQLRPCARAIQSQRAAHAFQPSRFPAHPVRRQVAPDPLAARAAAAHRLGAARANQFLQRKVFRCGEVEGPRTSAAGPRRWPAPRPPRARMQPGMGWGSRGSSRDAARRFSRERRSVQG